MNKKGEAVLVLTPSQEEPFIKRLSVKNIEVNKIQYVYCLKTIATIAIF